MDFVARGGLDIGLLVDTDFFKLFETPPVLSVVPRDVKDLGRVTQHS